MPKPRRILSNNQAVRSNLIARETFSGTHMPEQEKKHFRFIGDDTFANRAFFRYRGMIYAVKQFQWTEEGTPLAEAGWNGVHWLSENRALVLSFPDANIHWVIIGEIGR